MLYNKNNVRKTNDKKILHKVGKQWKVVSVALLMALGGGAAVATHANAQQTANNNFDTNSTAQEVAGNDSVAKYSAAPKPVSSAKVQSAKPASQVSYLSGYNGSAASFKAQASTDQSNYDLNNAIVQGYVNSLNAQYPTQTKSLGSVYNSAADQTSADQSSYASYSAIAAQSGWASKVNSLAAKANMSSSAYIESVGAETSNFNFAVSNDVSLNSEMSTVDSYANLISELASNSYKNPLMTEMKGNARVAEAKNAAAQNYVNNAVQISNDVDEQSSANENSLYDNQASLAANSADEAIAITNAPAEKAYVQSLANSVFNSSYANSSAVSTAVSAMASDYNKNELSISAYDVAEGTPLSYVNSDNSVVAATDGFNNLPESEADAIAAYSGNTQQYRLTVTSGAKGKYNVESYAVVVKDPKTNQIVKNGFNVALGSDLALPNDQSAAYNSAAVVSEVSDTAAQFRYDNVNASLNSAVNAENSAVSSFDAQSASASQGVQKALNNSASASSAYQAAQVLANNPTFANLFSTPATTKTTFGHAAVIVNEALSNLFGGTKLNDNTADALANVVANKMNGIPQNVINNDVNKLTDSNKLAAHASSIENAINGAITNSPKGSSLESIVNKAMGNDDNINDQAALMALSKVASLNPNLQTTTVANSLNEIKTNPEAAHQAATGMRTILQGFNNNVPDASRRTDAEFTTTTKVAGRPGILNANSYSAAESVLTGVSSYTYDNTKAPYVFVGGLLNNASDNDNMSYGVKAFNSVSDQANTQLASDKASSASYSVATDANVALANSYATSYSADANSDVAVQSAAKTNLDNFYLGHASNASKFGSAMSAANSLSDAVPSDNASAEANGLHVYYNGPKYIFVTHAAQLHTDTNYGSKDDKVLGKVAKGTPLSVLGVGFAANGATRYVVKVNGHKGYFTGNPYFSQQSYLDAMDNVDVAVNRSVRVYKNGKAVATKKPGYVFKNASVVSVDGIKHGFTRVEVGYNEFVTANVNYVTVQGLAAGNTNASEASQVQSESSNKLVNFQNDLL